MTKPHVVTVVAVLPLLFVLASCAYPPSTASFPAPKRESQGIDATRNAYVTAWKAADADRIAELYAEDALVMYPNQPAVIGRGAIRDYFKAFFGELVQKDFALASDEIVIAGPWAFDRGTYRWQAVPRAGGDPVEDNGKYLVVLQQQTDGTWKIARDMDNSDRAATQATRGAR